MQQSMKSGFLEAAGTDPAKMKILMLTVVVATLFVVAAWIVSMLLESYMEGDSETSDVVESVVRVIVVILIATTYVAYF